MALENLLTIEEITKRYPEFLEKDEKSLLEEWKIASDSYHNRGISIMTDERFDSLEIAFKHRFPNNKEILKVGHAINDEITKILGFEKVEHTRVKGKTQHKAQNVKELESNLTNLTASFKTKLKDEVQKGNIEQLEMNTLITKVDKIEEQPFIMSEKLDGASLYSTYDENGDLFSVVSRGDGEYGDNITANAKKVIGIPLKIDMTIYKNENPDIKFVEIRGEGIMLNKDFKELVKVYNSQGKDLKNARNAAAGILRRLDGQFLDYVNFMPYEEIIELKDGTIYQRDEDLQMTTLDSLGFKTPYWSRVNSIQEMEKEYSKYIETQRKKLRGTDNGYEIDGLVFKLNSSEIQKILGMASNRQNGQVALKFPPEIAITKLIGIEWSESYNGIITPVAIVEPISIGGVDEIDKNGNVKTIGGVTIERLSLANQNIMDNLLLEIGDNIVISRRNDVIPKIEKNLKLEEAYIEYHKFMQTIFIPELDKTIISLDKTNKIRDSLLEYKDIVEMELSSNMGEIELKINAVILESLFKDGEFLKNSYKNDKKIFTQIFRNFTSDYRKELNKMLEVVEKGFSKKNDTINILDNLFENIKEKTKELVHNINPEQETLKNLNNNNIQFVKNCPTCGTMLITDNSNQTCNNSNCDNIKKGKIGIFITKNKQLIVAGELGKVDKFFTNFQNPSETTRENFIKTLNTELSLEADKIWTKYENGEIKLEKLKSELEDEAKKSGIGDAKISELYEKGIVKTIKDLFFIKQEDFIIGKDNKGNNVYLEGWGKRAISNLIKDINKLKKLTDVQFLTGMNLKSAASSRIEKLLEVFNYKDLIEGKITIEDITNLKGFGENIAKDLLNELETKREEILELMQIIEIKESKAVILTSEEKVNFVITGSVLPIDNNNPSDEWKELEKVMIEKGYSKSTKIDGKYIDVIDRTTLTNFLKKELGHEIQSKVTKNTDYLINIDTTSNSSKNQDAKKLGVEIIAPEEVLLKLNDRKKNLENKIYKENEFDLSN